MISEVDENMSGSIDFAEFLKVLLLLVRRGLGRFHDLTRAKCTYLISNSLSSPTYHNDPPTLLAVGDRESEGASREF